MKKRAQKDMRIPREIWMIFDPMRGPITFASEKAAWRFYRQWNKGTQIDGPTDSFWEIAKPARYVPLRDEKNNS